MSVEKTHPYKAFINVRGRELFTITKWLDENFGYEIKDIYEQHNSPWTTRWTGRQTDYGPIYKVYFKREEDAMFFILRWGSCNEQGIT